MVQKTEREDLVTIVKRVAQHTRDGHPCILRKLQPGGTMSKWQSWEKVKSPSGGAVEWHTGDKALKLVREVRRVDDGSIMGVFGAKRNGVKHRAVLRFKSGHLDINTLRAA